MSRKLKELMRPAEHWPEQAQEELAQLGEEIDEELRGGKYEATREELRAIDEAVAEIEHGTSRRKRKSERHSPNSASHERRLLAASDSRS